jgi:hypothetical protein
MATAMGVTAAAYTNNDLDPSTGTTLFDIDDRLDQVPIQAPANAGTRTLTGKLEWTREQMQDSTFTARYVAASRRMCPGFAALNVAGTSRLYEVSLLTGSATHRGKFSYPVTDVAIQLDQG